MKAKERVRRIFEGLDELMKENQIDLYVNVSREEIFDFVDSFDEKVLEQPYQLDKAVFEGVAKFKISHFQCHPNSFEQIVSLEENSNDFLGYESSFLMYVENGEARKIWNVTHVNGKPIEKIKSEMQSLVPEEVENTKEIYFPMMFSNGYFWHMLNLDSENILTMQCEDERGEKKAFEMAILPPVEENSQRMHEKTQKNATKIEKTEKKSTFYDFEVLKNGVLKIDYRKCKNDENYPFAEFVSDIEKLHKEKKFSSYILDLRDNKGGDSQIVEPLLQFVQDSKLFGVVLTSDCTFSSAVLCAADFRKDCGAQIVGQATACGVSGFGDPRNVEIEGFHFGFTNMYVDSTSYYDYGGAVEPDVPVSYTFEETLNNPQKTLQVALSIIKEHEKQQKIQEKQ